VGLFGFLRKKDERAIPEPGTPEFDAAVQGSALPDSQSVSMGETGWTNPDSAHHALQQLGIDPGKAQVEQTSQTIDLRGSGARDQILEVLRQHGIDPDKKGQTINATSVPGLQDALMAVLKGKIGMQIPNAGGFGGGVAAPQQDPLDQVAYLDQQRDAGKITDAEFEAQKKRLLGEG
jgi:hypothetical protein